MELFVNDAEPSRKPEADKPRIKFPDFITQTNEVLASIREEVAGVIKIFSVYNNIVIGLFLLGFLVLTFTLATILYQSWEFNVSLKNQVDQMKIQEEFIRNSVTIQKEMVNGQKEIIKLLK